MEPGRRWFTNENCSVARTLEVIGERWTLLVLREAFLGVRRFEELQRNTGAARNILAARLRKLVERGILERRPYEEHPPRFEYRLTGIEHKACGHDILPQLVCSECGGEIAARDVIAKPGPGALRKPA